MDISFLSNNVDAVTQEFVWTSSYQLYMILPSI